MPTRSTWQDVMITPDNGVNRSNRSRPEKNMGEERMRARRIMASSSSPAPPSKRASNMAPPPPSPPWEVVLLLAQTLDPKTLAKACCVSKSWYSAMSSDRLWRPICLSHYPSSLHLVATDPALSARRLFALLRASSQRRHRNPSIPRISLRHLIFAVDIFQRDAPVLSLAKPGEELCGHHGGVFRFEAAVNDGDASLEVGEVVKIGWTVVMKGWRGAFAMMDRVGKGRAVGGDGLWFSEGLPSPGCCSASMGGGLEAELGLEFSDDGDGDEEAGRRRVARMSMGLMSIADWRYVGVDDGLLYLQHFLLPNNI
ncbi:probable F-box protein At5g04010 [Phoenix dactylifera]|uniref:F-box protein n=1 Tax=Phoenix dactylifera TaxID=42345 RepID=A0A8B7BWP6_PHODC|nr:probable F-box protein At5g04010 [Phoenix dactylifera]